MSKILIQIIAILAIVGLFECVIVLGIMLYREFRDK